MEVKDSREAAALKIVVVAESICKRLGSVYVFERPFARGKPVFTAEPYSSFEVGVYYCTHKPQAAYKEGEVLMQPDYWPISNVTAKFYHIPI